VTVTQSEETWKAMMKCWRGTECGWHTIHLVYHHL